jgi:ATP synthase protein I
VFSRQLYLALIAAAVAGVFGGVHAAVSAFLGGAIGIASGYAYARRAMGGSGLAPKQAYRAQLAGEARKVAVTLLLFVFVFKGYAEVVVLPLFATYASTFVVYWMALLRQR